jgi:hypothetical protein
MATELIMRRERGILSPATAVDLDGLMALPAGKDLTVRVTRVSRSVRQHRFFWCLLAKVAESHPHYRSAEDLAVYVKTRLGLVDEVITHHGEVLVRLKSTSFANMDQGEFTRFMNGALDVLCLDVLPGLDRSSLVAEVEAMLGIRLKDLIVEEEQ